MYNALYNCREDNDVEAKPKFKIGDCVCILKKNTFEKGFTPNWTEELFSGVRLTKPITYNIKYLKGETIQRCFLPARTPKNNQEVYHINKVLRKEKGTTTERKKRL